MKKTSTPTKRPYLAKEIRRDALLDVACKVVEEHGWPALSMISVAETAKVSRQLVYQHFQSVDELMSDTMSRLFSSGYENIRKSISTSSGDLTAMVMFAEHQTFDERPARVRAMWQMITATYSDNVETARMSARMRHLIIKLWARKLSEEFKLNEQQSRAMAWMLNMAFWGAHQMEHDGEISRKTANELLVWMISCMKNASSPVNSSASGKTVRKPKISTARPQKTVRA